MKLGAFSISLTVKDIHKSKAFYEKLGFTVFGGEIKENWLIMKNGDHLIGLFEGMFDKNILTFNPGWDQEANPVDSFDDIRTIQKSLEDAGVSFESKVTGTEAGPGSFIVNDPDGNPIMLDQHR